MVEKVLLLSQIFQMDILMDLQDLRFPESKIHIFSCLSVCVYPRVYYQRNSETNYSRNFKFDILHLYHM